MASHLPDKAIEGALEAVDKASSVLDAIYAVRDFYRIDHATYHLAPIDAGMDAPYVKSTYSDHWLSRYLIRGYVRVDPVVREGFQRQLPFFWSDLPLSEDARDLMADAFLHGLGASGYSIPVVDKHVRRALFSLNSTMDEESWRVLIERNRSGLLEVASKIHRKAIADLFGNADPVPRLAPREIEVLHWAAEGKDYKAIATLLNVSAFTVRSHLRSLRYKLDCANLTQAVAKATKLGLLKR
jgi:DNA-binding CsgD family transcriptional regulator